MFKEIFYETKYIIKNFPNFIELKKQYTPLRYEQKDLQNIQKKLKRALGHPIYTKPNYNKLEQKIINKIQQTTKANNLNNVTRTQAYLEIYKRNPSLHWALLAHMVSRNGGWNMTDLKGEFLPHLLSYEKRLATFLMLERANALIFQDAYPQLLLFEESQHLKKNLFHLLDAFHVSKFMRPFWELYWNEGQSTLLTVALIINEQNYIENRVISNPQFKEKVIDKFYFKAQSLLQLNQVIFPMISSKHKKKVELVGLTVQDFANLHERIEVGKKLYVILFCYQKQHQAIVRFSLQVPHTGSRMDYWPQLFLQIKKNKSDYKKQRIIGCNIKKGAEPLFSPQLVHIWSDIPFQPTSHEDWFKDLSVLKYFKKVKPPITIEMTQNYCQALNKIELAVMAGNMLFAND
ncbi:DUF2515 family protein [Chengkuizengella axinellae]|uniref:DUF2515 family protein n=1 Tax=Chengkuizengella axinellae TaxID=3064388 RepID=A0ABT9ITB5_9BACL|nr:DUF2515 family protein [Chengkuizengella sp. 2205SS18-9]MDP5272562.1 DUF2515 family protein [Chengkuizengella sp. 2205SS18-9]